MVNELTVGTHVTIWVLSFILAFVLIGILSLFGFGKCPRCGGKFVASETYPNASVCVNCNYLRVSD
jgi:hypothetical protein